MDIEAPTTEQRIEMLNEARYHISEAIELVLDATNETPQVEQGYHLSEMLSALVGLGNITAPLTIQDIKREL